MNIWLMVSYFSVSLFRMLHFVGQVMSGEDFETNTEFNWSMVKPLVRLSALILCLVFPFFTVWSVIGTIWFIEVNDKTPQCVSLTFA